MASMNGSESTKVIKRGKPRKTNTLGDETIKDLICAAKCVLARDGASGFTLDRIAKQAQVTKGTLLYHFRNKDNLLSLLTDDYIEHLQRNLDDGIDAARASLRYSKRVDPVVAGFMEWYKSFRSKDESYTTYGLTLLTLLANNETQRIKIRKWYENLFFQLRQSTCKDALKIVLLLEGLFYLKHFNLDVTSDEEIDSLLHEMELLL